MLPLLSLSPFLSNYRRHGDRPLRHRHCFKPWPKAIITAQQPLATRDKPRLRNGRIPVAVMQKAHNSSNNRVVVEEEEEDVVVFNETIVHAAEEEAVVVLVLVLAAEVASSVTIVHVEEEVE
jgi:hypothetical protein